MVHVALSMQVAAQPGAALSASVTLLLQRCLTSITRYLDAVQKAVSRHASDLLWSAVEVRGPHASLPECAPHHAARALLTIGCGVGAVLFRLTLLQISFIGRVVMLVTSFLTTIGNVRPTALSGALSSLQSRVAAAIAVRSSAWSRSAVVTRWMLRFSIGLAAIEQVMKELEGALPASRRVVTVSASSSSTVEQTYECGHPYANSMDESTSVCIPGAQTITITFDPQTRTEAGCDWLRCVSRSTMTRVVAWLADP